MKVNMTNDGMMMVPFLHFAGGDYLLFQTWKTTSGGTIGGACVGVFFFAMFERWVYAVSPALIHYLLQKTSQSAISIRPSLRDHTSSPHHSFKVSDTTIKEEIHLPTRTTLPFIVTVVVPWGMMYAFQRLLEYALMLVVMTFHAGYILSMILGLALGEILFGGVPCGVAKDESW